MRKLLLLLTMIVFVGSQAMWAQTKTISGTITASDDGMPLPGVSVVVKGTTTGTVTNANGQYSLTVPTNATTLVVSFIGMKTQEIAIDGRSSINVAIENDAIGIEEVIAVAYGTAKKSSFTGSIASVSDKHLTKIQSNDPAKALEGALAGVSIVSDSGQPGQDAQIRIRGIGSINASSAPLIIVDGAPYDGSLSSINNADIESMNVLKDAASAALYGARGANGVILITTKKSKSGETKVSFDARVGQNYRGVKEYDIMTDPGMYYETFWKALKNQGMYADGLSVSDASVYASGELYNKLGYNIYNVPNSSIVGVDGKLNPNATVKYKDSGWNDWEAALMEPQLRQEYNLSISKGTDVSKVFFSAGYLDDKGYNKNSGFERFTSKFSYDTQLFKWLDFGASTQFSKTESNWTQTGSSYTNSFMWTRNIAPIYPIYLHDASGMLVLDQFNQPKYDFGNPNKDVNLVRAYGAATNPVATQDKDKDLRTDYYLNQNVNAKITLPYNFVFSTNYTIYGNWFSYDSFTTPTGGSGLAYNGIAYKYREQTIATNWNQILNWSDSFGLFNVTAMLGHEIYGKDYNRVRGSMQNFLDPENDEFANAAKITSLTSYTVDYRLEGYFGQATVDYANKYYLSASMRRDGSSVFHPDNRWGTFWSVGGSWRINQESFLKDVSWIDNLKLKASYGAQGNDYLYLSGSSNRAYSPYHSLYEVSSNGTDLGFSPKYKGRKEVTWEKNLNFNVGAEFSVFNGLLAGEVEYFAKETKDLLFNLPVPVTTGFTTEPWNIGNMTNKGIEVTLNSRLMQKGAFKWDVNANMTHFKNEVTKLPEEFREKGITRGFQKILEGGSIYDFHMVKWAGVDPNNGDALYWTLNKTTNEYEKVNGDKYDSNSRQKIGTSLPDLYGGFGTSFEYSNFDLSLQFAYQIGGLKYDDQYSGLMHVGSDGDNWHKDILNSWTPENTTSKNPRLEYDSRIQTQTSDRFITDASYLSFKNITLGYTLPKNLLQRASINSMRVYFVVDNVNLWSKRQGMDPRTNWSGETTGALYSPIRTVSFGLTLNL